LFCNRAAGLRSADFSVSSQSSATTVVAFSLSPTGFFALITKFSCLNADCSQAFHLFPDLIRADG
jgi:hypothetical protein